MPPALLFLCLLTLPARALAARVAVKEEQEVPWKQAVVLGTLLGGGHAGDIAAKGVQDRDLRAGGDLSVGTKGDAYAQVQALLMGRLGGGSPDLAACMNLMESLRRSKSAPRGFVQDLQARLSAAGPKSLHHLVPSSEDGGQGVEALLVAPEDGSGGGISIVRYPRMRHRDPDWVTWLHRLLSGVEVSIPEKGLFLSYYGQSHTAEQFDMDPGAEVILMSETYFGTISDIMSVVDTGYDERLSWFLHAFLVVQRLNQLGIPHRSALTPENVFVLREDADEQAGNIVLSPSLLLEKTAMSAEEMWRSDIRQLGTLLRSLSRGDFPEGEQEIVDVFLAFGKAMEAGALPGDENALAEFVDLLRSMSPTNSDWDMHRLRLLYLRRAVDAEMEQEE